MENLQIDGGRLWDSLMQMAAIGATKKGGVCRLTLTDLDRQSRDLFISWCESAGCSVAVDAMGNIFARRPGRDDTLPPVVTGSHLDSQPTGGKFDGAYGVLAGGNRDPSSFVQTTTSTGASVSTAASFRVRMSSNPASTP